MNDRISKSDVLSALARYGMAMAKAGIADEYELIPGSKTYGHAWRLMIASGESAGSAAPGTVNGYLGMTKGEAFDTLGHLSHMTEDINYHRRSIAVEIDDMVLVSGAPGYEDFYSRVMGIVKTAIGTHITTVDEDGEMFVVESCYVSAI